MDMGMNLVLVLHRFEGALVRTNTKTPRLRLLIRGPLGYLGGIPSFA